MTDYDQVTIRGTHDGKRFTVKFHRINKKQWDVTIDCGNRLVTLKHSELGDVRPCPTHAKYLLDHHFPSLVKAINAEISRQQFGKDIALRSNVLKPKWRRGLGVVG